MIALANSKSWTPSIDTLSLVGAMIMFSAAFTSF